MASFCEGCPDRGGCVGPISSAVLVSSVTSGEKPQDGSSASISFINGEAIGSTTAAFGYRDVDDRPSNLVVIKGYSRSDVCENALMHIRRIDQCDGPTEVKKFFGLITKKVCSAAELDF